MFTLPRTVLLTEIQRDTVKMYYMSNLFSWESRE